MICLIALVVCGILGIFSVKYRIVAKEAFDCVFRRLTLRKCTSGLDKRLKGQITGTLMRKTPKIGRFVYNYFEPISWFFTILLVASLVQSGVSVYNYIEYGNCNGKGSDEFCIFDPLNTRSDSGNPLITEEEFSQCGIPGHNASQKILLAPPIGDSASFGNKDAGVKVIEFGCYSCQYTKDAEYVYDKVRQNYNDKIEFVYKNFPILNHEGSYNMAIAAECVRKQDETEFWKYHTLLLESEEIPTSEELISLSTGLNIDQVQLSVCIQNQETKETVDNDMQEGYASGIYGTPTVFVNQESIVGPKSYREVKKIIDSQLD